jgi:hypothetical protein
MIKLDDISRKVEKLAAVIGAQFLAHAKDRDSDTLALIARVSWGAAQIQQMMETEIEDGSEEIERMCRIGKIVHDLDFPVWKLEQLGITSPIAEELLIEGSRDTRQSLAFHRPAGRA